jgi:hypothetical protein
MFHRGLATDHGVGNTMHLLALLKYRRFGINKSLEGCRLLTVKAQADNPYLD